MVRTSESAASPRPESRAESRAASPRKANKSGSLPGDAVLEAHAFLEMGRWFIRDEQGSIDARSKIERSTHLALEATGDDGSRQYREIAEREHAETHEQSPAVVARAAPRPVALALPRPCARSRRHERTCLAAGRPPAGERPGELGPVGDGEPDCVTEGPHPVRKLFTERLFPTEEMGRAAELDQDGVRRAHADRGTESERHVRYGRERPLDAFARDPVDLELRNERARLGDALPLEHAVTPGARLTATSRSVAGGGERAAAVTRRKSRRTAVRSRAPVRRRTSSQKSSGKKTAATRRAGMRSRAGDAAPAIFGDTNA